MVRLPLPMVMVGVLVALARKVMLVLPPLGILALTEAMSLVLELENEEDKETFEFAGPLVWKMFPLLGELNHQESAEFKVLPLAEVLTLLPMFAEEEPLKIQRVWLLLSWLG